MGCQRERVESRGRRASLPTPCEPMKRDFNSWIQVVDLKERRETTACRIFTTPPAHPGCPACRERLQRSRSTLHHPARQTTTASRMWCALDDDLTTFSVAGCEQMGLPSVPRKRADEIPNAQNPRFHGVAQEFFEVHSKFLSGRVRGRYAASRVLARPRGSRAGRRSCPNLPPVPSRHESCPVERMRALAAQLALAQQPSACFPNGLRRSESLGQAGLV